MIEQILQKYELEWTKLLPVQKGYRNESHAAVLKSQETINVIIHKCEPRALQLVRTSNCVSTYLSKQGLPTRSLYSPKILVVKSRDRMRFCTLNTYLEGDTIPWEAYTMNHIKLLGKTLRHVHTSLQAFPQTHLLSSVATQQFILAKGMQAYFAETGVQSAMAKKLGVSLQPARLRRQTRLLDNCQTLPHQQALHMDFVRGNVLFKQHGSELQITGILDFEKTAYGHPVFDLARTLAFLLVDCKHKTEPKVRKYFIASGYNKDAAHPLGGTKFLEELLEHFVLHDFYKFLRHNPYEFLAQNQHYQRTRDLLLSRGILDRIGTS